MLDLTQGRQRDALAFGASSLLMVLFVEGVKALASSGKCSSVAARKCMHCGAGPIFVLTWPMFTPDGGIIASLVPLAMTLKFAATGLGIVRNDAEVKSMCRSGDRRELLRGPFIYGSVFVLATLLSWRSIDGVAAVMALCLGDGLAEPFGRRFGQGPGGRLPWSRSKSWAGSGAFLVFALAGSAAFAALFYNWGWSGHTLAEIMRPLLVACAAGALVESLPLRDFDNLVVPVTVALVLAAAKVRM